MFVIAERISDRPVEGLRPVQSDYDRNWKDALRGNAEQCVSESSAGIKRSSRLRYRSKWYRSLRKIKKCFRSPMRSDGLVKFDLARHYSLER